MTAPRTAVQLAAALAKARPRFISYKHNGVEKPRTFTHRPRLAPATWNELKAYKPTGDPAKDHRFLSTFIMRLSDEAGDSGCLRRRYFREALRAHPIRWHDYPAWNVDLQAHAKLLRAHDTSIVKATSSPPAGHGHL